jgi:hypothetical protein
MKLERSLPYSQEPAICPYPEPHRYSSCPPPPPSHFSRSHLRLSLSKGLLPSGFPTKTLYAPLLAPYVLHSLPISVFFTSSPEWYLVRNTEHKARCYVVFSTPPLTLRTKHPPQHHILENPQSTFKFMTICVKRMSSHGLVSCKICTHVS